MVMTLSGVVICGLLVAIVVAVIQKDNGSSSATSARHRCAGAGFAGHYDSGNVKREAPSYSNHGNGELPR
ncbi:MAG TPA: hypothetical protein VMF65_21075 [Acidimicrobiales bacterium]|nr:hypothetical protein [Acidimicrobiales bacterium]